MLRLITRDDVVSQRLKFGSAFLWFSWESKIALFFKLSRILSPSRKNGMILLAAISNDVQVRSCVKLCGTIPQLEVTYAFKKFSCKNSQFENLNDAHNIYSYVCNLLSLDGTNYFVHEKLRIGVCFSAVSSQRSSVRISHGREAEALI